MQTWEKLRAWRLAASLSQRDAAERAGISQSAWCEYESGKGSTPKVDQALRISRVTEGGPYHVRVEDWESAPAKPKSVPRQKRRTPFPKAG